jgi:aspartyl-tRNA(Asn)/glutamyl-tRNA(Gln) amidotransferase subunit B
MIEGEVLSELKAKEILRSWAKGSYSPKKKLKEHKQISGQKEISKFVDKAIKDNPKAVGDYKSGEKNALNFLIGQVMRLSNKRADFATAKKLLEKKLK